MKRVLIKTLSVILVIALILLAAFLYFRTTPQYAMLCMYSDYREGGMDEIYSYLTEDGKETVYLIKRLSENKLLNSLLKIFSDEENDFFSRITNNPGSVKWGYEGTKTDGDRAAMTVSFDIGESINGTLDLILKKSDGVWKIDGFENLHFEKFELE